MRKPIIDSADTSRPASFAVKDRVPWVIILGALVFMSLVSFVRDTGLGGPHHDEVIALLAAKGLQREYAEARGAGAHPLGVDVPASVWHDWVRGPDRASFDEIWAEVRARDKHPPLAFWVLNQWLASFNQGGYLHALALVWLGVIASSVVLGYLAFRHTGSRYWAGVAICLFLIGNSAIYTATWVRQYSLLGMLFFVAVSIAFELVRRDGSRWHYGVLSALMALTCALGMMTQYTFATITIPLHLSVLAILGVRRSWRCFFALGVAYLCAAGYFFLAMSGVMEHVRIVSEGVERPAQWVAALSGVPNMLVPVPSSLPQWLDVLAGVLILATIAALAVRALAVSMSGNSDRLALVVVVIAGAVGAGAFQVLLVGAGYFPAWGTGANHLFCLWGIFVLLLVASLATVPALLAKTAAGCLVAVLAAMQVLYAWNCHRILPNTNTFYAASLSPEVVLLDNLARGFVLQVTETLKEDQLVLVAPEDDLAGRLAAGYFRGSSRLLYLPIRETVELGNRKVVDAARGAGWRVTELPVNHPGLYDAFLLEGPSSTPLRN